MQKIIKKKPRPKTDFINLHDLNYHAKKKGQFLSSENLHDCLNDEISDRTPMSAEDLKEERGIEQLEDDRQSNWDN